MEQARLRAVDAEVVPAKRSRPETDNAGLVRLTDEELNAAQFLFIDTVMSIHAEKMGPATPIFPTLPGQ